MTNPDRHWTRADLLQMRDMLYAEHRGHKNAAGFVEA